MSSRRAFTCSDFSSGYFAGEGRLTLSLTSRTSAPLTVGTYSIPTPSSASSQSVDPACDLGASDAPSCANADGAVSRNCLP